MSDTHDLISLMTHETCRQASVAFLPRTAILHVPAILVIGCVQLCCTVLVSIWLQGWLPIQPQEHSLPKSSCRLPNLARVAGGSSVCFAPWGQVAQGHEPCLIFHTCKLFWCCCADLLQLPPCGLSVRQPCFTSLFTSVVWSMTVLHEWHSRQRSLA